MTAKELAESYYAVANDLQRQATRYQEAADLMLKIADQISERMMSDVPVRTAGSDAGSLK